MAAGAGVSDVDGADEALLARLTEVLAEPPADDHEPYRRSQRSPKPVASADLTADVGECLARASLARDGGAFIEVFGEAIAAARPGGRPGGSLEGFTVAVKDLMSVAGHRLTAGSGLRSSMPLEAGDAEVVGRLRAEGVVFIGTTALHEFAFGVTGINRHTGTPVNPRVPSGIPGGSSSGSAVAVAQRSARVAIGTDTGGSVRIPGALCGVVGFKPARGSYPLRGVYPLAQSLDHVGLLARTVPDIVSVHVALGHHPVDPSPPTCVGVVRAELEASDQAVAQECEQAVRRLASHCRVVDVTLPAGDEIFATSTAIMFSEAAAVHGASVIRSGSEYGADVRRRLLTGRRIPAMDYLAAQSRRQAISRAMNGVLGTVSCLVGPTVPILPPAVTASTAPEVAARLVAFTRLANVVGCPALTLPLTAEGPPVGLQITAATDKATLAAARYLERLLH